MYTLCGRCEKALRITNFVAVVVFYEDPLQPFLSAWTTTSTATHPCGKIIRNLLDGGSILLIYYGLAAFIILLDQLTKWLVVKNMELGEKISIADPYLGLLSHRNKGAAWGMLEGQMWLFYIVTVLVAVGIIYFFHKEAKDSVLFGCSLMFLLGGAIGNFIDRLWRKEVVDFVDVLIPVINYDFPIFNVADAALTIGVVMIIIHVIMDEKKNKKKVS